MGSDSTTAPESGAFCIHCGSTERVTRRYIGIGGLRDACVCGAVAPFPSALARPAVTPGDAADDEGWRHCRRCGLDSPGIQEAIAALEAAAAPTSPAPVALVATDAQVTAALKAFRALPHPTDMASEIEMRVAVQAALDATLSGQQGGAVPAGDDRIAGLDFAADIADHWHQRFMTLRSEASAGNLTRRRNLTERAEGAKQVLDDIRAERARLAEHTAPAGTEDVFPRGAGVGTYFRRLPDKSWIMLNSSDQWVTVPNYVPAPAGTGDADRVEGLRPGLRKALEIVRAEELTGEPPAHWLQKDVSIVEATVRATRESIATGLRAALDGASDEGEGR